MTRSTATLFLTTVILFGLSSCSRYYYIPNIQNVPLFKEKNEYRASVARGYGNETSTIEAKAAYSVTNNFAVMANFMSARGGQGKDTSNNWAKGKYFDGAIGYYKPFEKNVVFEIYGGFGASNQHHQYADKINNGTADLSFTKFFIQPSIGLTFNAFDFAFSTNICRLDFYKINNQVDRRNSEFYQLDTIAQNKTSYLFEPSFTIRGGWKYVKVQVQYVFSQNLNNKKLRFEDHNVSIGLYITIAKRYWLKSANKQNVETTN